MPSDGRLLEVRNLRTHFDTDAGTVRAVDGVDFHVDREETLGVVGESGSGKSVTALSIMGLVPQPPGRIVGGEILFEGRDLLQATEREVQRIRGNAISMIFQNPQSSLNPVLTVGRQIAESVMLHRRLTLRQARAEAAELLRLVGIAEPERRLRSYPHELSGGMCQRVMIAIALSGRPKLLIADEPTTALDVTIQAQILGLLRTLRSEFGMGILFITHDLGVVREVADRVLVLYAGRVVEAGRADDLFKRPRMPYTVGLLDSVPVLGRRERLRTIPGAPPQPGRVPCGCAFHPRCAHAEPICSAAEPPVDRVDAGHAVRCHRWRELDFASRP